MKPTPDQLKAIRDATAERMFDASEAFSRAMASGMIEEWEAIRPKDDYISEITKLQAEIGDLKDSKATLERSRDARIAICNDLAGRVAELTEERDRLKAMIPEWIPVSEDAPESVDADPAGEVVCLHRSGYIAKIKALTAWDSGAAFFLPSSSIRNLPKREPASKPTAEETMQQEFELAWKAWQAAKNGGPTS